MNRPQAVSYSFRPSVTDRKIYNVGFREENQPQVDRHQVFDIRFTLLNVRFQTKQKRNLTSNDVKTRSATERPELFRNHLASAVGHRKPQFSDVKTLHVTKTCDVTMAVNFAVKKHRKKVPQLLLLPCDHDERGCGADEVISGLTYDKRSPRTDNRYVISE